MGVSVCMKKIWLGAVCMGLVATSLLCSGTMQNVDAFENKATFCSFNQFENFTSKSYVLLDANSGTILASHNENQKMQVASICKLMTCLLTLEKIDAGVLKTTDMLTASEHACSMEGSQAFLDAGSSYSVAELLKSVIVASANDSAVVLAESICGTESLFVAEMNKRAKELGMNNTMYANATGLPAPNQYSTAMDTSIILEQVAKHNLYVSDSNIWMDSLVHPSGRVTELVNTNRLIKYYDKCKTGKTGFTDEAGYCLASTASNGNLNLVAVTLKCDKAQDRFKESMDLFNYGFANFENFKVVDADSKLQPLKTNYAKTDFAPIEYKQDFYVVCKKGEKGEYDVKLSTVSKVDAPNKAGNKVGFATIVNKGKVVGEVEIVLSQDVEKQSYADILAKIGNNWRIAK